MEVKEKEKLKQSEEKFSFNENFSESVNNFGKFQQELSEFLIVSLNLVKFETHLMRLIEKICALDDTMKHNGRRFPPSIKSNCHSVPIYNGIKWHPFSDFTF